MVKPLELVIFDCDGVLVDSERVTVPVDVVVLAKLGWPVTEAEVIEQLVGQSDEGFVQAIETQLGRRLPDNWADQFTPLYQAALEAELARWTGSSRPLIASGHQPALHPTVATPRFASA